VAVAKSFDVVPQQKRASIDLPWSEVQPEWTLNASAPAAARTEFLAVMAVQRRGPGEVGAPVSVRPIETTSARGGEWRTAHGRWLVLLRRQDGGAGLLEADGLQGDGQAVAVLLSADGQVLNAFVAAGRRVSYAGRELFASPTPRDWAMDVERRPEPLTASLVLEDLAVPMQGLRRPLPDGDVSVWWATLDVPQARRCDVEVVGWSGWRPPHLRLGGTASTGVRHDLSVRQGQSCLTLTGKGTFDRLVLRNRLARSLDARRLPADLAALPGDILIEAERPAAESERKGKAMEKVAASGGQAYCQIDGPVQWVEWAFGVPAAGTYALLLRGAGESPEVLRELSLDGQGFPAGRVGVRMPATGGWCRTTNDWAWFEVTGADGKPATAALAAGPHVLRLEFVQGSQNVDALVLRPVPAAGRP
jgi:hypothetical protein